MIRIPSKITENVADSDSTQHPDLVIAVFDTDLSTYGKNRVRIIGHKNGQLDYHS